MAEYFSTSNFEVSVEGLQSKQFSEVEGLRVSIENLPYQEGAMHLQQTKKGRTRFDDLVLRRRFDGDKEFIGWLQECSQKKVLKRSGSIILKDDDQKEVLRFNFTGAWPVAWKAPSFTTKPNENEIGMEEIVLSVETLEMA
ncbi:MAG: phage tail protein [Bradymonadales bacterium]|nr:MAG: phage tail protein [Bradymonadales bacterium]